MNKNFKKLKKDFLLGHTNSFKIIALTKTWLKMKMQIKTLFIKFQTVHKLTLSKRDRVRVAVLSCFVHNFLNYKERHELNKSNDIIEIFFVEITVESL